MYLTLESVEYKFCTISYYLYYLQELDKYFYIQFKQPQK